MTYPTLSITVKTDRMWKLEELLALYRRENHTTSRSEVFWDGIDALHAIKCTSKGTEAPAKVQEPTQ